MFPHVGRAFADAITTRFVAHRRHTHIRTRILGTSMASAIPSSPRTPFTGLLIELTTPVVQSSVKRLAAQSTRPSVSKRRPQRGSSFFNVLATDLRRDYVGLKS